MNLFAVVLLLFLIFPKEVEAASSAKDIISWEIAGSMAARNQNQGWNASVNWWQQGSNQYQIRLYGPIGGGAVVITKKGNKVTLRDGNHNISSSDAGALLEKKTGVRLPVNNLYYWIRGLPAPGKIEIIKKDSANHLLVLKQAGFLIEYKEYKVVNNVVLPTNIRLQKGNLVIKFVVRRWKY